MEAAYARDHGGIVPVRIDLISGEEIPFGLHDIHATQVCGWDGVAQDRSIVAILDRIRDQLAIVALRQAANQSQRLPALSPTLPSPELIDQDRKEPGTGNRRRRILSVLAFAVTAGLVGIESSRLLGYGAQKPNTDGLILRSVRILRGRKATVSLLELVMENLSASARAAVQEIAIEATDRHAGGPCVVPQHPVDGPQTVHLNWKKLVDPSGRQVDGAWTDVGGVSVLVESTYTPGHCEYPA